MPSNYDAFGDILSETQGVFGAEQAALQPGLKRHQSVHSQIAPAGVVLQFECQVCGQPAVLAIEWPEIVAIKYGVNPTIAYRGEPNTLKEPTRWEFNPAQNGWKPDVNCQACNASANKDLLVEPHEPERFLQAARRRGYINPAGEQRMSQICARAAQGGQGVRR